MITLVTLIHIFVCFFLIIVVLLQSGKSGDIAAAFGGQGSQTAFGPRGAATVLTKATTWCADHLHADIDYAFGCGLAQDRAEVGVPELSDSPGEVRHDACSKTCAQRPLLEIISIQTFASARAQAKELSAKSLAAKSRFP